MVVEKEIYVCFFGYFCDRLMGFFFVFVWFYCVGVNLYLKLWFGF